MSQHSYEEFAFHKIYHRINNFCGVELSAFYFDVLKDRLYTSAPKSVSRRAAQTAIWRIGEALVRLLAPIMSFTCEEVWQYLPLVAGRLESVHLTTFPEATEILGTGDAATAPDPKAAEDWKIYTNCARNRIEGAGRSAESKTHRRQLAGASYFDCG